MKNDTNNIKLINPSTGEFDWDMAWWKNTEILDSHPGVKTVSSAELPEEPWTGQLIFLWDCSALLAWNGERWLDLTSGAFLNLKCGEEIKRGELVALNAEGMAVKAGPETDEMRLLGIAVTAAQAGEKVLIKTKGKARLPEFQLETGSLYFAGPGGGIKSEPQEGQSPVGIALAVDILLIK